MYDKSDPRAALAAATPKGAVFTQYRPSDYVRFYEKTPQHVDSVCRTWLARGNSAVISYSETKAGASFQRTNQLDEWVILLPDASTTIEVTAAGQTTTIHGYSINFVPAGASSIKVVEGGRVVQMFTARSSDLAELSLNAELFREPNPNIPPFIDWPEPKDGWRVRSYSLDVPPVPGRFGRIWRCTTFMVNVFYPAMGPRDVTKLSPHHHDEFEQFSLALEGSFIHHLRWAWTPDMTMWKPDEHEFCGTPSLAIIPPPAIHTTRSLDPGANLLIDIFAPPRMDFTMMDGWVLNNSDYPIP
jgi:hypothetical protein